MMHSHAWRMVSAVDDQGQTPSHKEKAKVLEYGQLYLAGEDWCDV